MKLFTKLITAGCLFLAAGCQEPEAAEDMLYVRYFSAGKADAILLYTDESAVLIDTGLDGYASQILRELNRLGIDSLDAMILTHFDKDHIGSADEVLENISVGHVWVSDSPKDSDEYEDLMEALEQTGIHAEMVFGDERETFELDGITYTIDGPDEEEYKDNPSNNSSLIVSVQYGETSFLFMGDAQNDRIREYLEDDASSYDVLKVPYHGNYQKQLKNLIASVQPEIAVITCSSFEGGEEKTMNLLEENGVETFRTDKGSVLIASDGKNITADYN